MPGRELRSALPGAGTDRRLLETGVLTGPGNHPVGHEIGPDDSETDFSHRISVFYHSGWIFRPEASGRSGVLPDENRPLKISKIFRTIQLPGIPDFPQRSGFTPETRDAGVRRIALRRDAGSVSGRTTLPQIPTCTGTAFPQLRQGTRRKPEADRIFGPLYNAHPTPECGRRAKG